MVSIGKAPDIVNLAQLDASTPLNHWVGVYRSETAADKVTLSDGRRQIQETNSVLFPPGAFDRSACPDCNCGHAQADQKVHFMDCAERHPYICEFKGGPSCPNGMFSLYGNCLGFVKNHADSVGNGENCYFQSGSRLIYEQAVLENTQVYLDMIYKLLNTNSMTDKFVMIGNDAILGNLVFQEGSKFSIPREENFPFLGKEIYLPLVLLDFF